MKAWPSLCGTPKGRRQTAAGQGSAGAGQQGLPALGGGPEESRGARSAGVVKLDAKGTAVLAFKPAAPVGEAARFHPEHRVLGRRGEEDPRRPHRMAGP